MMDLRTINFLPGTGEAGSGRHPTDIRRHIIHCSGGTPGTYINSAERIHDMHRAAPFDWDAIGYHYVITRNGSIQGGRPLHRTGAGVRGHNADTVHTCLIGGLNAANKAASNFTVAQWVSLKELSLALWVELPIEETIGHCDLDPLKTCPNFDVADWWAGINAAQPGVKVASDHIAELELIESMIARVRQKMEAGE